MAFTVTIIQINNANDPNETSSNAKMMSFRECFIATPPSPEG